MERLHGIVPPVVTPLHADETVDEPALERQLGRLLDAGVHGIYFLGTTGEQPALRDDVRDRAIRAARRVVGTRVPLVVGCMASSTARAIDCLRAAERAGADAVAVTPPHYYASRGPDDQLAHYRACIAAASGPVVVYNIPSTTKVALAPETLARLAALEGVVAIKDSSADLMHFLRVLDLLPEGRRCAVLIGSPPLAGAAILYGGDGAVPGTANIDPTTLVAVYEAARRRDLEQLRVLQRRVHRLGDLVSFGAPVVCIKTALELMGVCAAHATAPFQPLGPEQRDALRARLVELELLPA